MANSCRTTPPDPTESSSLEDYLEAILVLSGSISGSVRVTDLSDKLGVSKPSVSVAVRKLADAGLVSHERYGDIKLTTSGRRRAQDVAGRHELLSRFLKDVLGVNGTVAEQDACRLEHDLSLETVIRLSHFVEFLTGGQVEGSAWNGRFERYLAEGKHHVELVGKG